ncbi:5'-3' exoribonuclease 3 [Morus notabilis]|uniref:5'-3' exoribonuclease n=1 Tax=Morus notabilis TaxID=981085 RepID=W9RHI7_9ROSA|nr:5'-3' exoribonuclease 3 [Morus notabilis]EXB91256.1 5'-3' exoribonuclease 3 [Morus notabilis]
MGVPSFYRWLVDKYPKVVENAIEETEISLNTSLPNPNGIEFDNLYLDMNGIIHPCFHPEEEDISTPSTFEEVFKNMFEYIDRLFNIVRPRKLLYMAVDGVAPRAKMNQQRARRFRTSKDKEIAEEEELKVRQQFEMEGKKVLPKEEESEVSDSNIITPGTEFMHKLSEALKSYISLRLRNDLGWRNIKVILSDANVPGEGEHKIMSFIRLQRTLPSYNANTRHCLYGLDADLILLSLATHEVHFSILRENVKVQEQNHRNFKSVRATSHSTAEFSPQKSRGWFNNVLDSADKCLAASVTKKPYQFLHVWILREYLELDMRIDDPPENFKYDFERIVDDFIFMCFFVGNDFLPHTPSLAIHEGAIDLLMTIYKNELKKIGGYLVDMNRVEDKKGGFIKPSRVERFILSVGAHEEKIFKKRSEIQERKLRRLCLNNADQEDSNGSCSATETSSCAFLDVQAQLNNSAIAPSGDASFDYHEMLKNTNDLKEKVRHNLRRKADMLKGGFGVDKVRLGSPGYKERYYKKKFSAESPGEIESIRKRLVEKYSEGLLWVLLYYFSEPPSWNWFYPYHYGPFVSDLKGLSQVKLRLKKGVPFNPFDQLLSVLPSRSGHALPKAYQALMNDDSPIVDFYPTDFEIDVDGKRFSWQGICKLPFIDEERLLSETTKLENDLGVEERERNSKKLDQLLVYSTHKLGSHILSVSKEQNQNVGKRGTSLSDEIGGVLWLHHEHTVVDKENEDNSVLCVYYEPPGCGPHVPRLLEGVKCPEKTIREDDIKETQLWHEYQGKPPSKYTNIQQGLKKVSIGANLAVQSSEHRRPRSGWRAGRGGRTHSLNYEPPIPKSSRRENFGLNTTHNSNSQIFPGISYDQRYVRKDAGSGWGEGRGRPNGNHNASNPSYASSSFRRTSDMNMYEWRVVHSSLDGRNISVESRPSESNRTSGGFQAGSGSFLPSRNNAWRPSFRPDGGYGRGTSIGRGQQHHDFSENNQSFARNRSRQSYGRGCNIPYGGYYLT